jgi:hypothetical protein
VHTPKEICSSKPSLKSKDGEAPLRKQNDTLYVKTQTFHSMNETYTNNLLVEGDLRALLVHVDVLEE